MLRCENDAHLFEKLHSLPVAQTQLLFLLLLLFLLQLCDRSAADQGRNLEVLMQMDEFALFMFFYLWHFKSGLGKSSCLLSCQSKSESSGQMFKVIQQISTNLLREDVCKKGLRRNSPSRPERHVSPWSGSISVFEKVTWTRMCAHTQTYTHTCRHTRRYD